MDPNPNPHKELGDVSSLSVEEQFDLLLSLHLVIGH